MNTRGLPSPSRLTQTLGWPHGLYFITSSRPEVKWRFRYVLRPPAGRAIRDRPRRRHESHVIGTGQHWHLSMPRLARVAISGIPHHVHTIAARATEQSLRLGIGEAHRRHSRYVSFREGWRGHLPACACRTQTGGRADVRRSPWLMRISTPLRPMLSSTQCKPSWYRTRRRIGEAAPGLT